MRTTKMMENKKFYLMLVQKAQNLKDTQIFGKQSPQVILSIGKSIQEKATTTTKDKGGCNCTFNESIYVEIKKNVEFVLVEVKSGSDLIGLGRIAATQISEYPSANNLQLYDLGGRKAGTLTYSIHTFTGSLNALHARAQELKEGQLTANTTAAANVFLNRINRAPVSATNNSNVIPNSGGFHQHMPHSGGHQQPPQPIAGGFHQHTPHTGGHQQPQPIAGGFQQHMPHSGGQQTHQRPISGGDGHMAPIRVDTKDFILPARGMPSRLPSFWEERTDTKSGKIYYINHRTRESTWIRPEGESESPTSSVTSLPPPPTSPKETVNTSAVTAITATISSITLSSDITHSTSDASISRSKSAVAETETETETETSQAISEPEVSSPPTCSEDVKGMTEFDGSQEEDAVYQKKNQESPLPLPPFWEERIDAESGKTYYVNSRTRESTWRRPKEDPITLDSLRSLSVGRSSKFGMSSSSTLSISSDITRTASDASINSSNSVVQEKEKLQEAKTEDENCKAEPEKVSRAPSPSSSSSSVTTKVPDLPPNWLERTDANTNRVYYVNSVTKETTWTRPTTTPSSESSLPPNWAERVDHSSGKVYYVNHSTKETSWKRPIANTMASPPPITKDVSLPPNWEERVDRTTGKTYYVNHATKETSWTKPHNHALPVTSQYVQAASSLPPNWEERSDPAGSGRLYYVNHVTKQSTWDRPVR